MATSASLEKVFFLNIVDPQQAVVLTHLQL
jgi:hypothetical protein